MAALDMKNVWAIGFVDDWWTAEKIMEDLKTENLDLFA